MTKAPGIVRTHAHTTRPATPQRTAERRCVVPTPTIAPAIVCVVETGIPASVTPQIAVAEMFSGDYKAMDVLKWKEVTETLEEALDGLENVANVVETVVLKYA